MRRSVFYSAANGNKIEFGEKSEFLNVGENIEIESPPHGFFIEASGFASAMGTRNNGAEFGWATR